MVTFSWVYVKMVTFLLPFPEAHGLFPSFPRGNLVGLLELNPRKLWSLPKTGTSAVFNCQAGPHSASSNSSHHLHSCQLLASGAASAPGKLWFSVLPCLSRFQGGGLSCDLSSPMNLRQVVDFQCVQFFSCEDGSINSQVFTRKNHLTVAFVI